MVSSAAGSTGLQGVIVLLRSTVGVVGLAVADAEAAAAKWVAVAGNGHGAGL